MDNKSAQSDKTAAIKEIHNIEKTNVLLLRDLPFITRLSKYYDLTLFDSSLLNRSSNSGYNKPKPIPKLLEQDHKDVNQFVDSIDVNEALEILRGNKLDINKDNSKTTNYKNIDDAVLEEMCRQSQGNIQG